MALEKGMMFVYFILWLIGLCVGFGFANKLKTVMLKANLSHKGQNPRTWPNDRFVGTLVDHSVIRSVTNLKMKYLYCLETLLQHTVLVPATRRPPKLLAGACWRHFCSHHTSALGGFFCDALSKSTHLTSLFRKCMIIRLVVPSSYLWVLRV